MSLCLVPISITVKNVVLLGLLCQLGEDIYKKGEIEVPINRVIGICYNCDKITPVEKLPDEEYLSNLEKKDSYIANKLIEEEKKRKKLLTGRASRARCLKCGSHNFDVIPKIKSETSKLLSGKPHPTGYKHKDCSGKIVVKKSSANFFMGDKLPTKFCDSEGIEITGVL